MKAKTTENDVPVYNIIAVCRKKPDTNVNNSNRAEHHASKSERRALGVAAISWVFCVDKKGMRVWY